MLDRVGLGWISVGDRHAAKSGQHPTEFQLRQTQAKGDSSQISRSAAWVCGIIDNEEVPSGTDWTIVWLAPSEPSTLPTAADTCAAYAYLVLIGPVGLFSLPLRPLTMDRIGAILPVSADARVQRPHRRSARGGDNDHLVRHRCYPGDRRLLARGADPGGTLRRVKMPRDAGQGRLPGRIGLRRPMPSARFR